MRRVVVFSVRAALCLLATQCAGTGALMNYSAESCAAGRADDCWQDGELWLHKASWSHSIEWSRPVDANQARVAFRRGCKLNSIRACASLIERHLVDDHPAERSALLARLEAAGVKLRSDEELAELDKAIEEVAKADAAHFAQQKKEQYAQAMQQLGDLRITGTPGNLSITDGNRARCRTRGRHPIAKERRWRGEGLPQGASASRGRREQGARRVARSGPGAR